MFDSPQRELASASSSNTAGCSIVAGVNQWGVPIADFLAFGLNTEGQGARMDLDGVDAYGFSHCFTGRSPDIEDIETEFQFLHLAAKFSKDSCGFGKYRGGSGTEIIHVVNYVNWALCMAHFKGRKVRTSIGLFGGYPSATLPGFEVVHTNIWEKMKRNDKDIPSDARRLATERPIDGEYRLDGWDKKMHMLENGDLWAVFNGGGGGYGDVLERDPGMVMEDLRKEIISHHTAKNVYFVAYDTETFEVDYARTRELRQEERDARKSRGMKWAEFEKEWSQLRPTEEAMDYYGSWPDGNKTREIIRM
jgi:N-methylhydantoinase B/oxoprolinase/acetone carboxylase alpha subunit